MNGSISSSRKVPLGILIFTIRPISIISVLKYLLSVEPICPKLNPANLSPPCLEIMLDMYINLIYNRYKGDMPMDKLLKIPNQLWERIEGYLKSSGFSFTEFAKRSFDEFLKKEGK